LRGKRKIAWEEREKQVKKEKRSRSNDFDAKAQEFKRKTILSQKKGVVKLKEAEPV